MKALFVCSGNKRVGISPIVKNQGMSLEKHGVEVKYFPVEGKGILGYLKNTPHLKKVLKSNGFDLIHAHYWCSGVLGYLARSGHKLVISFMGSDLIIPLNSTIKERLPARMLLGFNRFMARHAYDLCIVKSKELKSMLRLGRAAVVPNGVDFDTFQPQDPQEARKKLKLPPDKKIVLFAADPARPEKNYQLASDAVQRLAIPGMELLVVYDKDQDELVDYYNAADALLLTSLHEGSPNVVKEAMACNLPIVSVDVGDVKEIISGTQGCYLTNFDPEDIADKLAMAISFGKRTQGREHIRHLESNETAATIVSLYSRVLNS